MNDLELIIIAMIFIAGSVMFFIASRVNIPIISTLIAWHIRIKIDPSGSVDIDSGTGVRARHCLHIAMAISGESLAEPAYLLLAGKSMTIVLNDMGMDPNKIAKIKRIAEIAANETGLFPERITLHHRSAAI